MIAVCKSIKSEVCSVIAGEAMPSEITHLVAPIRSAFEKVKAAHPELSPQAMIRATVRLNVLNTVATLTKGQSFG